MRSGPVLGVDLNADHLACCVLDSSGNPIGEPAPCAVETAGLGASRRDGRVRAAISALFTARRAELHGDRGGEPRLLRGPRHRPGNPRPRPARETAAPHHCWHPHPKVPHPAERHGRAPGIAVIGVDPAYTSRSGAQHWRAPLQQQTSDPVTTHHAAAAAIGRRGLGLAIRRRPAGPRTDSGRVWHFTGQTRS